MGTWSSSGNRCASCRELRKLHEDSGFRTALPFKGNPNRPTRLKATLVSAHVNVVSDNLPRLGGCFVAEKNDMAGAALLQAAANVFHFNFEAVVSQALFKPSIFPGGPDGQYAPGFEG